ncbi:MAG: sterol desaturase family protein [Ferruginibacter sp.]
MLVIFYFVPVIITYYVLYVRNKEKFRRFKIQHKYPGRKQINSEIRYSFLSLFNFSVAGLYIYETVQKGNTLMYFKISDYGVAYFVFSLFLLMFINDTIFYWTHRLMHLKGVFRYIHLVHHKYTSPTPFAVFSFGAGESILHSIVYTCLALLIPQHLAVFVIFHLYNMGSNIAGHAGFEFLSWKRRKQWFFKWQNTVTGHDLHHKRFNCNYGNYFILWDKLMSTLSEKEHFYQ